MLTKQIAGRVYNYDYCVGRFAGQAGKGFLFPTDFALGSGESLYVVSKSDEFNRAHGITKCTLDHQLIWDARGQRWGDGISTWPFCVGVDSDENLYVSDDFTGEIFIYDKDGNHLGKWGVKGSGDGELNGPSGLAFDKQDNLFIADSLNCRIQKFTKDGTFLATWGGPGTGEGEFAVPWGVTVDHRGDVYVADWKNDRVQKFDSEGRYLATFGRPGSGDGELRRPTDVAIDRDGDVYVTDHGNNRLNIYDAEGTFLTAFIGDAHELSPWAQELMDANQDFAKARRRVDLTPEWRFERPVAVNVDDKGRIMVLETQRCRIQVYKKEQNFTEPQFNL